MTSLNIYSLHLPELRQLHPLEAWMAGLPPKFRKEVMSYLQEGDRWRILAGKLILRHALRRQRPDLSIDELLYTEEGRPYFDDDGFGFNLSHSGERLLLVTSGGKRCGVDIELHREIKIDLFRSKFTEGEWEAITGADDPQRVFFKAWCVKESVIKADGRGIAVLSQTEIMSDSLAVCDGGEWWYEALSIAPDYEASVACETKSNFDITPLKGQDLEKLLPQ